MADFWTADRTLLLTTRYDDGASYGIISREVGCTRSAVAGKVKRLMLPRRGRPRIQLPNPSNLPGRRFKQPHRKVPQLALVEKLSLVEEPIIPGRECGVFELDRHRCRYPEGEPRTPEFHFCGQEPMKGSPYCGRHHRLTHVRAKRMT